MQAQKVKNLLNRAFTNRDLFVGIGAILFVALAYLIGWLVIDVAAWIKLTAWQAQPEHIGGVRILAGAFVISVVGACVLGVVMIVITPIEANR